MTIESSPLAPALLAPAPSSTSIDQIQHLVAARYGQSVHAKRLRAERDEIFELQADSGERFILKLTSALEDPLRTDFQTQALLHVTRTDATLPTPRLILTTDGVAAFKAPWGEEAAPTVRLFSYLPGQPLYAAFRSVTQSAALGETLARLGLALRSFQHPGAELPLDWDVSGAAQKIPLLDAVQDRARRGLALSCLSHFAAHVQPVLHQVRWQVVHNDFNPHNVLVDTAHPDRLTGVIDFGDSVRTALVNDVAIGACYLLPLGNEPLDHPLAFVAAYHRVSALLPLELDLIYDLMAARLALAVAISEWRALRDPANRAYITKNTGTSWQGLERLAQLDRQHAASLFRRACEMENQL